MRSIHFNMVFANPDGIAVVERSAFHSQIVYECSVKAGEIFDDQPAAFHIDARMMVRYRKIINRKVIVG